MRPVVVAITATLVCLLTAAPVTAETATQPDNRVRLMRMVREGQRLYRVQRTDRPDRESELIAHDIDSGGIVDRVLLGGTRQPLEPEKDVAYPWTVAEGRLRYIAINGTLSIQKTALVSLIERPVKQALASDQIGSQAGDEWLFPIKQRKGYDKLIPSPGNALPPAWRRQLLGIGVTFAQGKSYIVMNVQDKLRLSFWNVQDKLRRSFLKEHWRHFEYERRSLDDFIAVYCGHAIRLVTRQHVIRLGQAQATQGGTFVGERKGLTHMVVLSDRTHAHIAVLGLFDRERNPPRFQPMTIKGPAARHLSAPVEGRLLNTMRDILLKEFDRDS